MAEHFRGFLTCECVVAIVPFVEADMRERGLIRQSLDFYQMGYHPGYGPSGGTHDAGGCFDTAQFSDAQLAVWRKWGCTVQHRTVAQGFTMAHGHGWPRGCPHLSPSARDQASQWEHGTNGLRSRGRIIGPWPILGFRAAIERNPDPMALSDDDVQRIAKATAALVGPAVWSADVIPNTFTGNTANKTVTAKTALSRLGLWLRPAAAPAPTDPPVTPPAA